MFCKSCENKIGKTVKFCSKCGDDTKVKDYEVDSYHNKYYSLSEKISKYYGWYMLLLGIFGLFLDFEVGYLVALQLSGLLQLTYVYKKHNWHTLMAGRVLLGIVVQFNQLFDQLLTIGGIIDIVGIIAIIVLVRYRSTEENVRAMLKQK